MGRAFEFRKARKLKRWGNMAKTFTRIGKQIAIAVKAGGPDPDNNSTLRAIIATAKHENMPKDNIERAIKNAMGKDQKDYKEMNYEGYGPHGIAIYVETLTDNTTRTVANVRSVFTKFGGTLGTSGSLDFIFSHKCQFTIALKDGVDMDDLILELIDLGIESRSGLRRTAMRLRQPSSPASPTTSRMLPLSSARPSTRSWSAWMRMMTFRTSIPT